MKFIPVALDGAFVIEPEPIADARGFFARTWCAAEFQQHGLNPALAQCSISFNTHRGTLRGMHYQEQPYPEAKLVRCCSGALYDVIVDVRRLSPTYCDWFGIELTAQNRKMLYIPEGFAHGFQTLVEDTEIFYQISESYHPECARGIRWNERLLGIQWPLDNPVMSRRDRDFPDFQP